MGLKNTMEICKMSKRNSCRLLAKKLGEELPVGKLNQLSVTELQAFQDNLIIRYNAHIKGIDWA